jgi:hypothetical protein
LIIVFGVSLRFVALKYNWRIPKIQSWDCIFLVFLKFLTKRKFKVWF